MPTSTKHERRHRIVKGRQIKLEHVLRAVGLKAVLLSLLLAGCNEPAASNGTSEAKGPPKSAPDFAIYDGPDDPASFAAKYKGHCSGGLCIIEAQPLDAPLKKANGEPLCAIGRYAWQTVVTAHFSREGRFQGAGCMIGGDDYAAIRDRYGRGNVYKRYLNQRGVYEDFLTWKTKDGFITTYQEILGRSPSGGVLVSYHVYLGPVEHRHYSEYAYD